MTNYLNEEQQVELLKEWWNKYGNLAVSLILLLGVSLMGWRWWQQRQVNIQHQASAVYEQLLLNVSKQDTSGIDATANTLIHQYPHTIYASLASLFQAREAVNKGALDVALRSLDWAATHTKVPAVKALAQLRAARVLLVQKKYDEVKQRLDAIDHKLYHPLVEEIRGDLLVAQGQRLQARKAYMAAQEGMTKAGLANRLLEMKIESLPEKMSLLAHAQA